MRRTFSHFRSFLFGFVLFYFVCSFQVSRRFDVFFFSLESSISWQVKPFLGDWSHKKEFSPCYCCFSPDDCTARFKKGRRGEAFQEQELICDLTCSNMYVLENVMFWLFLPVEAEPGFSAKDLNWREQYPATCTWTRQADLVEKQSFLKFSCCWKNQSFYWRIFSVCPHHLPRAYCFEGFVLG